MNFLGPLEGCKWIPPQRSSFGLNVLLKIIFIHHEEHEEHEEKK